MTIHRIRRVAGLFAFPSLPPLSWGHVWDYLRLELDENQRLDVAPPTR